MSVTDIAVDPTDPSSEIRKPHEMIVMIPRSKRVTLTGRRLYNALMQVAQARMSKIDGMPSADYMFEAPLPALLRTTGSSGEDRTAAKRYLREMRGLEVDWESTAPGDGVKWRGFSMLSEVRIEVRNGENWVSWSYPPTIMSAVREPTRWARIDLDILARLGTYSAVALYEICVRYRENPSGLTSRKPVQWWADALSQSPAGSERREWRKFKSERIRDAIDEINRETDLEIELIEHRQGRAVFEAQFAVRRKRQSSRQKLPDGQPVDANLVLRAESLGIRELKLETLIREFGEGLVRLQVDVLEKRAANDKFRTVENAYSYLRALLRNPEIQGSGTSDPLSAPEKAGTKIDSGPPAAYEAAGAEFLNARIANLKHELAAMEPLVRDHWVNRGLEALRSKGVLSAVVQRRAAQGDWAHGILGAAVVKAYALEVHGASWDSPPQSVVE